ncbi:MAG: AAA family ATPase [Actinobacteria bacterium]|nr:AAA family ATPase [Actinomycetota bacterium]
MQTDRSLPDRIHVFGASGAGTTNLGKLISHKYGHRHLDTDDFYWLPTDPPFREKRRPEQRLRLLDLAMGGSEKWVLSGSLVGWGDPLIPLFELVVFLYLDPDVRLARLRARELERYGPDAISVGGPLEEQHRAFMEWAAAYDTGGMEVRSRALHEAWMAQIPCPVVRMEARRSADDLLRELEERVATR